MGAVIVTWSEYDAELRLVERRRMFHNEAALDRFLEHVQPDEGDVSVVEVQE
jgi:hypothetical protein